MIYIVRLWIIYSLSVYIDFLNKHHMVPSSEKEIFWLFLYWGELSVTTYTIKYINPKNKVPWHLHMYKPKDLPLKTRHNFFPSEFPYNGFYAIDSYPPKWWILVSLISFPGSWTLYKWNHTLCIVVCSFLFNMLSM